MTDDDMKDHLPDAGNIPDEPANLGGADKVTDDREKATEDQAPDDLSTDAGKKPDVRDDPEKADVESPAPADNSEDADTFSREYVQGLRQESAGYRTQLRDTQEKLHRMMVEQTGQLADPADLPFDSGHLDNPDALLAAIAALLADRPHLKARRFDPAGAAQGPRQTGGGQVNLADIMRQHL